VTAKPLRIGIQGVRASFHDVAARRYFSDHEITVLEFASFKALCLALERKEADYCLMAIENTIAGSILPNYSLLERHGFRVMGETYLRIALCLMALPEQGISALKEVRSHPMALAQSQEYLAAYPHLRILEAADTAESARDIRDNQLRGVGAIASRLAAETYGLEILAEEIETDKQNYTRFLAICRAEDHKLNAGSNKATIRFEASHEPGSLAHALSVFHRHGVNLTKIQSVPLLGRPYQYSFHVDLEWDDLAAYSAAMRELRQQVVNVIHFGEYPRGGGPSG
jgi:prephenate dehydratase